ncbi:MAG: MBL fold metallo-hydrolase [Acidobacteria bacterium]|nr:MBL fold metallo-hydrolase [Acidobacteriota bacterium]
MKLAAMMVCLGTMLAPLAPAQSPKSLDIYFVDVEGGQATLFVTPNHESLLIDTGWGGHDSRDAKRIVEVAKLAGLSKIDDVIITHFHDDHIGGVKNLLSLIPVGTFIDHGALYEHCRTCVSGFDEYMKLIAEGKARRKIAAVGEVLPFKGMQVRVVSADGKVISKPLSGAGQINPFCAKSEARPHDETENGKSVGTVISFGKFRTSDLGDLTWDMERELMCPVNRIGKVSLLVVSHHGWYQSSSPAYVAAVQPQIAVMDNGTKKGGSLATLKTLNDVKEMDLWQLHRSAEGGKANTADARIANLDGGKDGYYLKVSAHRDGAFDIFNPRTSKTVHYPAR